MDVKGFLIKKLKEENLTQTALARKLKEIQHVSSINEK